jgi:hypothetical protein
MQPLLTQTTTQAGSAEQEPVSKCPYELLMAELFVESCLVIACEYLE